MENGPKDNPFTISGSVLGILDQNEHAISPHDLMTRRLKNRERQRRYRARKRLEADMKKASILNQSTLQQLQLPENPSNCVTRVHCRRNWKRDARNAFVYKEVQSNGPTSSNTTSISGSQTPCLPSGIYAQLPLDSETQSRNSSDLENGETPRTILSRRHWKLEARNKKN